MKYIFLIVSLFFFNFFLFSCSEKISNEEIIEMVKLDLQNCPAPSGKTDLWFKHYGIGDVERANIVVTHYQRLLNYIIPDFVHILVDGRIISSGDKNLALELEEKGYDKIIEEAKA